MHCFTLLISFLYEWRESFTRAGHFPQVTLGRGSVCKFRSILRYEKKKKLGFNTSFWKDLCLPLDDATAATTLFLSPATTFVSDIIFKCSGSCTAFFFSCSSTVFVSFFFFLGGWRSSDAELFICSTKRRQGEGLHRIGKKKKRCAAAFLLRLDVGSASFLWNVREGPANACDHHYCIYDLP